MAEIELATEFQADWKWREGEGTQNHVTLTETRADFTETRLLHLLLLLLLDLTEPPIELELRRKWALLGVRAWNEANRQWPVMAVPSWHAVAMDAMSRSWNLPGMLGFGKGWLIEVWKFAAIFCHCKLNWNCYWRLSGMREEEEGEGRWFCGYGCLRTLSQEHLHSCDLGTLKWMKYNAPFPLDFN